MKTAICKLYNRWYWSVERAGIMLDSPAGGCIWIPKGALSQLTDLTDAERAAMWKCGECVTDSIELTMDEMKALLDVAKRARGGTWRIGKNVAAPQVSSVASKTVPTTQKSYAQRKFERNKRIQNNRQKILGGCCPGCDKYALNVKRYTGWVGYYCKNCKGGGSITMKK